MADFVQYGEPTAEGKEVAEFFDTQLVQTNDQVEAINALPGHVRSWYVNVRKLKTMSEAQWLESNQYAASIAYGQLQAAKAANAEAEQKEAVAKAASNAVAESLGELKSMIADALDRLAKLEGDEKADEEPASEPEAETPAESVKPSKKA